MPIHALIKTENSQMVSIERFIRDLIKSDLKWGIRFREIVGRALKG